ncbi:alpha/beta hydrolase [Paenibacillus sp. FSL H7-0357]|uniref:alpha/beta hydrolase n=1 Tax=Paenibacillus sp. FSL H7-0357 TaxID=1536774 RepID=UPI000691D802|nr:alpha/beta hydrolase [Paenibacillus sp. FSL H7-0357]
MQTPIEQLQAMKSFLKQTGGNLGKPAEQIRSEMAEAAKQLPALPGDVQVKPVTTRQLTGEWVIANCIEAEGRKRAILYFHGGGFISGNCEIYRDLAARLSSACSVPVLTVEYRLAPEHRYPAANEDCLNAYRWMLAEGYSPDDIILGGDSVGATLALMTMISVRDAGEKMPAGAFLLSPHSDLVHLDGYSYDSLADSDPTGSREGNQRILEDYLGGSSGEKPAILSPLRLYLHGLPHLYIQVGDQEVLLSDAERLADRARADGVEVTLEVWENMWSVFQFMAALLPEAQQAIMNIGSYTGGIWGKTANLPDDSNHGGVTLTSAEA